MFHRTMLAGAAALLLAQAALAADDTTPPKLNGFSLETTADVNVLQPLNQVLMRFEASDGGSGLSYVQAVLTGPSGQPGYATYFMSAAPRTAAATMAWQPSVGEEAGLWRITRVDVVDAQGLGRSYNANALKRMGSATKVRVRNVVQQDKEPPQLVGGAILTPTLSKSDPYLPGGMNNPYKPLRIQMHVTDTAPHGRASGYLFGRVTLCGQHTGTFFFVDGPYQSALGTTDYVGDYTDGGGWVGLAPDIYEIGQVMVSDAGQTRVYVGPCVGGSDDMSALFPGGTRVTITE